MKVYIVGDHGPEHNSISSVHKTYKGAFKAWNSLRKQLKKNAEYFLKDCRGSSREMYERIIKNLSCSKQEEIDNYPHETPYIQEYELKE